MLQPHTERSQSSPQPRIAKARESDVEQIHGQSSASKLHPIAGTQSRQLQVSLCWPVYSNRDTNTKQGQNTERTRSHVAHGQFASAPKEKESLGLFLNWDAVFKKSDFISFWDHKCIVGIILVLRLFLWGLFNMHLNICWNYTRTFCYTLESTLWSKYFSLIKNKNAMLLLEIDKTVFRFPVLSNIISDHCNYDPTRKKSTGRRKDWCWLTTD